MNTPVRSPVGLLTIRDVMLLLKLGRTAVHLRIHSGQLPVLRIGRCVRVDPADLERFLKGSFANQQVSPGTLGTKPESTTCPAVPGGERFGLANRTDANPGEQS